MNQFKYVFRNPRTGELRHSVSHALIPAAQAVGIDADKKLGEWDITPWMRWECWKGSECIWHYDEAGTLHAGVRRS